MTPEGAAPGPDREPAGRDGPGGLLEEGREIATAVWQEWRDDRVTGLSAEIAFFGVLSLFPALLATAAALGAIEHVVGDDVARRAEEAVLDFLGRVLSDDASDLLAEVQQLFAEANPGALTVGAALAIWSASRGFTAVITALDIAYGVEEHRGLLARRAMATALALGSILVGALILAMLVLGPLLGTGQDVADAVGLGSAFAAAWNLARLPVAGLVMIGWATTVYHVAPNHRTPWRWELPGALLATAAWLLASLGLRTYLELAGGANQVLGALGGSLIVLVWLYLLGLGLLLGGELNAVLSRRAGAHRDPEPAA